METIIKHNQSLFDLSIQQFGSIENVFDLAVYNNISVTEILTAGSSVKIPETVDSKAPDVQQYYAAKRIKPATALTDYDTQLVNNDDPCNICKYFK